MTASDALVPSLCKLAEMATALSYPIDEARHREILEAIAARRREQEARGGGAPGLSLAAEPA